MSKPRPIGITGCSVKDTCKYFWYIWRHKYFVFRECCKLGIPLQGFVHDNSKFSTDEFGPYLHWFYDDQGTNFNGGYTWEFTLQAELNKKFQYAWNHHIHNNPHHWEYWTINGKPIPMPDNFVREMVADWIGFGKAKGTNDVLTWYPKQKLNLHDETRKKVEQLLKPLGFHPAPCYKDKNGDIWTISDQCINPGWWIIVNGCICSEQEAPARSREEAIELLITVAVKERMVSI
jgi:hypothetical protein